MANLRRVKTPLLVLNSLTETSTMGPCPEDWQEYGRPQADVHAARARFEARMFLFVRPATAGGDFPWQALLQACISALGGTVHQVASSANSPKAAASSSGPAAVIGELKGCVQDLQHLCMF